MTEDDLVKAIKERSLDPKRWTSLGPHLRRAPLPPATREAASEAVTRLGFSLPPLLPRLWVEVANGGFGPGYGLFGLERGHAKEGGLTLVDQHLLDLEEPGSDVLFEGGWPEKLVQICDWGCLYASAIDCSTSEGEIVDLAEGEADYQRRKGLTFAQWMEAWVNGERLWDVGRPRPSDRHRR
jgi:hypothetical protein